MLIYESGGIGRNISEGELKEALFTSFEKLEPRSRVLAIPPDFTRVHSQTGILTRLTYQYYGDRLTDIMPALGTHAPMSSNQLKLMFGNIPENRFRVHHWREDVVTLGEVPGSYISEVSEGKVRYSWPVQINKLLFDGNFDLILSFGQVVPHEVIGMAGYTKNILIGTGGKESIHKSHFLGAVYGMERIMGKADTPVRRMLDYAGENFLKNLPIVYISTVISRESHGKDVIQGLYIGDDQEGFRQAAELSVRTNIFFPDKPLKTIVVYLDPEAYKSTWLGNKSIYRTRMALADGGHLIVLAPGVKSFGEDRALDHLIRKYGYRTTPEILRFVEEKQELQQNLAVAAHLIHGSSENRFSITYCPGYISKEEVEQAGFRFGNLKDMSRRYPPGQLKSGMNILSTGEEVYFISNPGAGLWTSKNKFE